MPRSRSFTAFAVAFGLYLLLAGGALAQTSRTGTVVDQANLRAGPGTTFAIVGSATAGSAVTISTTNAGGDWYQLNSGAWIAAFLVEVAPATTISVTATARPIIAPVAATATVVNQANLRRGPGTSYALAGSVSPGTAIQLSGRNQAGDWYQLPAGAWIAAFLVEDAPANLPVVAQPASPPTAPTPNPPAAAPVVQAVPATPLPAAEPVAQPTAAPGWRKSVNGVEFASDCDCTSGDRMNCGDFGPAMDAQACYLRCLDVTGYDVHKLDRDKDGAACEYSW